MARWRSMIIALLFTATCAAVVGSTPALAAGAHRALVVVDTGSTTYRQVITFDGDSVTGLQALELAGANPVVYSFAGQGGAVCRLFGVGRDAGPNCLGGADGDNRYWGYFRAPSGTSTFSYSRAGAGSVQVHDGDVEGWKFGTGQAPSWSGVPPVTTTTTRASTPPPTAAPPAGPGPAPTNGPGAGPANAVAGATALGATDPNGAVAPPTTTDPVRDRSATDVRGARVEKRSTGRVAAGPIGHSGDGGGGNSGSLIGFAVVAGLLGGGVVYLRRSRRAKAA